MDRPRTIIIDDNYISTWTVDILPMVEQQQLYSLWRPGTAPAYVDFSRSPTTSGCAKRFVPMYTCPSDVDIDSALPSGYRAPGLCICCASGRRGPIAASRAVRPQRVTMPGDYFWDNPRNNLAANTNVLPDWTRGPLHAVIARTGTAMATDRKLKPVSTKNIADGTSNTLLVGEYITTTYQNPIRARRTLWCYAYTSFNQSSGMTFSWTRLPDYNECYLVKTQEHDCKRAGEVCIPPASFSSSGATGRGRASIPTSTRISSSR